MKSLCTATNSSPALCSQRKPSRSNEDPTQPKIKKEIIKKKKKKRYHTLVPIDGYLDYIYYYKKAVVDIHTDILCTCPVISLGKIPICGIARLKDKHFKGFDT